MLKKELIVDNFAGGGGASTGIEMATGHNVDMIVNISVKQRVVSQKIKPWNDQGFI